MKKMILAAALSLMCTAAFAQKFAHLNSQEVFQLMPEMDDVRAKVAKISKDNEEVLKSMYDEFQTKYQAYQQKAATWTDAVRETKEKELTVLENNIRESQQSLQQEIQTIQNNLTAPVVKKFQETLAEIGKKGGYIYIFDSSTALYIDPAQSTDITAEVRKALNIPEGRTLETLQQELQAQQAAAQE